MNGIKDVSNKQKMTIENKKIEEMKEFLKSLKSRLIDNDHKYFDILYNNLSFFEENGKIVSSKKDIVGCLRRNGLIKSLPDLLFVNSFFKFLREKNIIVCLEKHSTYKNNSIFNHPCHPYSLPKSVAWDFDGLEKLKKTIR